MRLDVVDGFAVAVFPDRLSQWTETFLRTRHVIQLTSQTTAVAVLPANNPALGKEAVEYT